MSITMSKEARATAVASIERYFKETTGRSPTCRSG
jgi:hypothetical protein